MHRSAPPACAAGSYFLCGIGGSGMSALARILSRRGCRVGGSDRNRDRGESPALFEALGAEGIALYPQDGSGVALYDALVVSTAVEETVPDVQAARLAGLPVFRRAEILAGLFNAAKGIGIGGTSGKTTVCAMTAWIFTACGCDPVVVNGGVMRNFDDNVRAGEGAWFIAETDESDGSIACFSPEIAIVTNITLDHKPLEELRLLFDDFLRRARLGCVLNLEDPESAALAARFPAALTFGIDNPAATLNAVALRPGPDATRFRLGGTCIDLPIPGLHNVSNALAAIGAGVLAGLPVAVCAQALEGFRGTARRLERVGEAQGVTVIDDFAHNPDKIAASLRTLRASSGRLIVAFQLHGFGPARLLREGLVQTFARTLEPDDVLLMPEIFYAGGSARRDCSAQEIVQDVARTGKVAHFFSGREAMAEHITQIARSGDRIVVMGARDDTLTAFAQDLLKRIEARKIAS